MSQGTVLPPGIVHMPQAGTVRNRSFNTNLRFLLSNLTKAPCAIQIGCTEDLLFEHKGGCIVGTTDRFNEVSWVGVLAIREACHCPLGREYPDRYPPRPLPQQSWWLFSSVFHIPVLSTRECGVKSWTDLSSSLVWACFVTSVSLDFLISKQDNNIFHGDVIRT